MADPRVPRTVRVEIELADGTVRRLVGDAAEAFQQVIVTHAICAIVHGVVTETPPWETVKPSRAELRELEKKYEWADWVHDVQQDRTRLGYAEWLQHKAEAGD